LAIILLWRRIVARHNRTTSVTEGDRPIPLLLMDEPFGALDEIPGRGDITTILVERKTASGIEWVTKTTVLRV
jgi:ABC-type nitrate/sulfonate/bicarbonate transport system ATPase subunit